MTNLKSQQFGYFVFFLFALCFIIIALLNGNHEKDVFWALKTSYQTLPWLAILLGIFFTYGWKLKIFQRWLVQVPNVNGTWEGTIHSTWKDLDTGKIVAPIPAILTIKQSLFSISCIMRTKEMTSYSYLAGFWIDEGAQIKKIAFSYQSDPLPSVQYRSAPHNGTAIFEIVNAGNNNAKLNGTYWTSRKTTGEIYLRFQGKKLIEEFPKDTESLPSQL